MTINTLIDFTDPHHADGPRLRCAFGAPREVLEARTLQDVPSILAQVQAAAEAGAWCVGMLAYEAAGAFDGAFQTRREEGASTGVPAERARVKGADRESQGAPLARFEVHDAPRPWADSADGGASDAGMCAIAWEPSLTRMQFDAALRTIAAGIAAGAYYQVNFTAPLTAALPAGGLDAHQMRALFARLQEAQPGGYAAMLPTGDGGILSVSPELFFDWDSRTRTILARPMKGTCARGATPEADAAAAQNLCASPKERAENVMVVDLLRNDLSRIAESGSVRVPRLFHAEALPTVWQMTSDVQATTRHSVALVDVFAALFPCGSITGAPKAAAMQAIADLERAPRGVYCGALGIVRPGSQGGVRATFNVPIRTVSLHGDTARCGIGSGITAGSQPDAEWQEWQSKRAFLVRASAPFELLETFALVEGSFRHADLHLERMAASAAHFGYEWNAHAVRGELQITALQHMNGSWRIRLLVAPDGAMRAEAFELPAAAEQPVRLQLAKRALMQAHGEFVRHKTTQRAHYDAFAPQDAGVFDTVLFNEAGEITECTRGNIAAQVDGRWVTPPLTCGLLPGVGRALAVKEGRVSEAVLRVADVKQVQAWAFINSLRGWLEATVEN